MNRWSLLLLNSIFSAFSAALVYQLPLYLLNKTYSDSTWIILFARTILFSFYPIIPLLLVASLTLWLSEKYKLALDYQCIAYTGAAGLVYLSIYFWLWPNLPLYNIAPMLIGTAVFVYLQYRVNSEK